MAQLRDEFDDAGLRTPPDRREAWNGPAPTTAPPADELYGMEATMLQQALQTLTDDVGRLYVRLDPVMTRYDSGDETAVRLAEDDADRDPDGDLIETMRHFRVMVSRLSETVGTIERRLVLPRRS